MKKIKFQLNNVLSPLGLALLTVGSVSYAQTVQAPPPDAGAVIQQIKPVLQAPVESKFEIEFDGDASQETLPGGPAVELKSLKITGNLVFSEAQLLVDLGEVTGRSYDLAGFRKLSNQISQYYRTHGYPFARAYIPAQDMKDGLLTIRVLEGYYGTVQAKSNNADVQVFVQSYLQSIKPGDPIASAQLERVVLIMNDIPGIKVVPAISPGEATGTGDLSVLVADAVTSSGYVSADNLGARYTGYNRLNAGYKRSQVLTLGDEVELQGLLSDESMIFGRLAYSVPVSANGLRSTLSYSRTQYTLAKDFSALNAVGVSDQYAAGLTYPLVRSQLSNVNLNVSVQRKELTDDFRAAGNKLVKSSQNFPLTVGFDSRDQLLGGGLTYGALTYVVGSMTNANDYADTVGEFHKTNLDLARIQNLASNLSLFVKYSGQNTNKNLDSSEDLFLGGSNGVRAYPQGEAAGDHGYVMSVELRYQVENFLPYVFYDAGAVSAYARPTVDLVQETRQLAGGGLGVRYARDNWTLDFSAAWQTEGGKPTSDLFVDPKPRLLLTAGYRF